MAGSQFLYLPTHYIKPSLPAFKRSQHGEQAKGAEGGEGRCQDSVSILRSRAVLSLSGWCVHWVLIRSYTEMVDVREKCLTMQPGVDSSADSLCIIMSGRVKSYSAVTVMMFKCVQIHDVKSCRIFLWKGTAVFC